MGKFDFLRGLTFSICPLFFSEYTAVGRKVGLIEQTKDVRVNGKALNEKLILGSAYAPAHELAAALCLQIEWEGNTKTVILRG
ncbi:hypothetical protein [Brevibacillus brevis]|uniref:hypothetical protein n=1 Tax=Brevibacillus brevis TaxID=1393 RepID=UPI0011782BD9|nr:hypothetical protein [Brevibacillus brevis]